MKLQSLNYSVNALKLNQNSVNKTLLNTKSFEGNAKAPNQAADVVGGILAELFASIKTLLGFKISTNSAVKSTLNKTV